MTQDPHDPALQVPRYSWYALGVLFLIYLVNFVDRQILSILANDIKADLGIGDAQLGFLYGTAFAIFYALFGIPLGRVADHAHRLRLLSAGLVLWSTMTVLSGLAKNFGQLTMARIGVGVGEASANPCAYSLISDWFPPHLRATALSLYSSGLFLGSGLSLVIGGLIVDGWNDTFPVSQPFGLVGWQVAFLAVGTPGLLLAMWALTLREPSRADAAPVPAQGAVQIFVREVATIVPPFTVLTALRRGPRALGTNLLVAATLALTALGLVKLLGNPMQFTLLAIGYYATFSWASSIRAADRALFERTWGNGAFIGIVIVYSAVCYIGYTVSYWAAPYAERDLALSKTELGLLLGAPNALGGFVGVILGGWLADRLHRARASGRLLVVFASLLVPVPLVIIGYGTQSVALFVACNFLTQMATATALGASAAASQALVAPRMRGTATAIFLLGPVLIGLALGPFLAGLVSELSGDLALGIKSSLLVVAPGVAALVLAIRLYPAAMHRLDEI